MLTAHRSALGRNVWTQRLYIPSFLKMHWAVLFPLAEIILNLKRWAFDLLEL